MSLEHASEGVLPMESAPRRSYVLLSSTQDVGFRIERFAPGSTICSRGDATTVPTEGGETLRYIELTAAEVRAHREAIRSRSASSSQCRG
jgi:hypothetical protein